MRFSDCGGVPAAAGHRSLTGWIFSRLIGVTTAFALVGSSIAVAQPIDQSQQNVPYGSPVRSSDQSNSSSDSSTRTRVIEPGAVASEKIEPVQISGDDKPLPLRETTRAAAEFAKGPPGPNEFERYVESALGRRLPRFGADLLVPGARDFALPATATVPPDYVLNVGDTVAISLTGSTEGSVDRVIDTDGKIFLPRVGSVKLAGVRYADLKDVISAAIGRQYRGYDVTVSIRQLRGIRVYVTGFANNPGSFSVTSLSTLLNAVLAAGGPSSGGSFRSVKLYRHGQQVSDFDLYRILRGGNRDGDVVLQNEDVIFIPPVGLQVAVTGSVNDEAIYELKPGETIETALAFAGGADALADRSRIMLYRVSELNQTGVRQIPRAEAASVPVETGDILQVLSEGTLQRPIVRQSVLVRIEGEVNAPGNYYLPANSTLGDVLAKAGGATPRAFLFGTRLERISVRNQQRASFREAVEQFEVSLAATPLTGSTALDQGTRSAQLASARAVLDRLRQAEPDGRVVLDIAPDGSNLPTDLVLENNDRIVIPPRLTTVGVFGAVYRPASFLLGQGEPGRVRDYIEKAGGALRAADKGDIFVVRANGAVLSRRRGAMSATVLPGDVIFVPIKGQQTSFLARLAQFTQVFFQLGLGVAALNSITQ